MDESVVRKRRLVLLVTAPGVIIPLVAGAVAWFAAAALGAPLGALGLAGLAGIGGGALAAAGKWWLRSDQLTQQARDDLRREATRHHSASLRQLQDRLRHDPDPRTGEAVRQLRELYRRLDRAGVLRGEDPSAALSELCGQAVDLYRSCLASLERSQRVGEAAREMSTDEARTRLLELRENLMAEVARSIAQLGSTLDHLQAARVRREISDTQLSALRAELETGLAVARRVEQRMDELEADLERGPGRHAEGR